MAREPSGRLRPDRTRKPDARTRLIEIAVALVVAGIAALATATLAGG